MNFGLKDTNTHFVTKSVKGTIYDAANTAIKKITALNAFHVAERPPAAVLCGAGNNCRTAAVKGSQRISPTSARDHVYGTLQ